jgi:hypothetical protein
MKRLAKIPSALLTLLATLKQRAVAALKEAWWTEPARVTSVTVSAIVAAAATLGLVIPSQTIEVIVALVLPILFSGELTRSQVRPRGVKKSARS